MNAATLAVHELAAGHGGFRIIERLSMRVPPGLNVIVGPNGAGKTTLLNALAGLLPRAGELRLDDRLLPPGDAVAAVRAGLALVPEGRQLFAQMSVAENLELGGWLLGAHERRRRMTEALAQFPKLQARAAQLAGTMSGGEQQMVAVARALVGAPRVLMLDEPTLGLAPRMVDELMALARRIADGGVTVLLVEQNVRKALQAADRGWVLERGRFVAEGPAQELLRSSAVREAYLGT